MALDPLALVSDVQSRVSGTIDDIGRLQAILADVSAAIRSEAGQDISLNTSTITVTPQGGYLHLPQHPVVAVSSVLDSTGGAVGHTWVSGWGFIQVGGARVNSWELNLTFPTPILPMTVTYQHGYDPVPADIVGICANVAARAYGMQPVDSGVTQETLGSYSISYGSAAAAGGFGFLPAELRVIHRYRRPRRPIQTLCR